MMRLPKAFILVLFAIFIVFDECYAQAKNTEASGYKITSLPCNTKAAEFSPTFYKDGVLFCSDRDDDLGVIYRSEKNDKPLVDVYFTKSVTGKGWKKAKSFDPTICSYLSEGQLTFNQDFTKVYFTRNFSEPDKSRLYIYESSLENGKWSEPKILPFINEKYSYAHPALSPTGNYMVFVSNMPGGFGGTDLYITYYKDGTWTKPANIGRPVNSERNEVMPFIHKSGLLYYASDANTGLGGFDIYSVFYNQFEWKNVKNIGHPFNTSGNDYGLIMSEDMQSGFFASNRLNGKDDDDIYYFSATEALFKDCDTLKKNALCKTLFEEGTIPTENSPLVYEWDFGDGSKKRGTEVHHCFPKAGIYTVQLNVVDLISDQVLMNEATYELEIEPIKGAYIQSYDTLIVGKQALFDASKSYKPHFKATEYMWDFGTGEVSVGEKYTHQFNISGISKVYLNVKFVDSVANIKTSCVTKDVIVFTPQQLEEEKLKKSGNTISASEALKKIFSIKDSEGNEYKIQLATSKKSLKKEMKKFEGLLKIDEYYDRNVFGYTTGSFKSAKDALPTLKTIRKIGFKEAVLIAQNNGKVVSGTDSSFFVNFDPEMVPLKLITMKGKITDKDGSPLKATMIWENLTTSEQLGTYVCEDPPGQYELTLPEGDVYAYNFTMKGYYPYSNNLDIRGESGVAELNNDIVLYRAEELANTEAGIRINNIFFAPDRFELQAESYPELKRLATFIKENTDYKYEIGGHSDNIGGEKYNFVLSEKRAAEVAHYLEKLGCPHENLIVKGYGNSKPLTSVKRYIELNRRVEIKVLK